MKSAAKERLGKRHLNPKPLKETMKERKKLLRDFTTTAVLASMRSWANHSAYVAVNHLGQMRTHHRSRTRAELRKIRRRQAHLQQVTLRSLTCAQQGKSSSKGWMGLRG